MCVCVCIDDLWVCVYVQVCEVVEVVELGAFQSDDGIVVEIPAIGVDHVISTHCMHCACICALHAVDLG